MGSVRQGFCDDQRECAELLPRTDKRGDEQYKGGGEGLPPEYSLLCTWVAGYSLAPLFSVSLPPSLHISIPPTVGHLEGKRC